MSDQAWLEAFVAEAGGVAGSVHRLVDDALVATAFVNIPPPVQAITATIPKGKGMAGLAWSRGVPVQTCDLATDDSGDVRPGAKAVDAGAAVALPVVSEGGLRAVVGVAFAASGDLPEARIAPLQRVAEALPGLKPHNPVNFRKNG